MFIQYGYMVLITLIFLVIRISFSDVYLNFEL